MDLFDLELFFYDVTYGVSEVANNVLDAVFDDAVLDKVVDVAFEVGGITVKSVLNEVVPGAGVAVSVLEHLLSDK